MVDNLANSAVQDGASAHIDYAGLKSEYKKSEERAAVVGGGISGLMMAKGLAESGKQVTVFEASNRFGGKIQSASLGGSTINLGAEFIDSNNKRLIALAKELKVELIPATDQKTENFQLPDGKLLSGKEFHAAYKPIAQQVIADKKNLIVDGQYTERAKHLNKISLTEYLKELASNAHKNGQDVDPKIVEAAARGYVSESGRDPAKINAMQFINEASSKLGGFLNSDSGYRVKGGTEELIKALRENLQAKGVQFETEATLKKISKNGAKLILGFEGKQSEKAANMFDKVALAVPMHALAKIEGLEELGMKPEEREFLKNGQYTNSSKFTVRLKKGVEIDNASFSSSEGFQAWVPEKGLMTVLAGGEKINKMKGMELVKHSLDSYAKAHGKKAEDLFELAPDKIVFAGVDAKKPCYASPAVNESMKLGGLFAASDRMSEHGLAIAGTFMPRRDADGVSVGGMEGGLASAERATKKLIPPSIAQSKQMTASKDGNWQQKIYDNVRAAANKTL